MPEIKQTGESPIRLTDIRENSWLVRFGLFRIRYDDEHPNEGRVKSLSRQNLKPLTQRGEAFRKEKGGPELIRANGVNNVHEKKVTANNRLGRI